MNVEYCTDDDPRYVYEFWADAQCLYVGCTARLGHRMTCHMRDRAWWSEVTAVIVSVHANRAAGEEAEQLRIRELQPLHNRVFTDRNDSGRKSWETRRRNAARAAASP